MELHNRTLGQWLEHWAETTPDKEYIVYSDRDLRFTWSEFNKRVDDMAKGMLAIGITHGTHVGVWATNVPDWLTFLYAGAKIGAVLVTINTNYKQSELEYLVENADIHTMCITDGVFDGSYVDMVYTMLPELKTSQRGYLKSKRFPRLRNVVYIGQEKYRGMYNTPEMLLLGQNIKDETLEAAKARVNCHDVVNMQYTSGTTGFSKGVMLTGNNLAGNVTYARTLDVLFRGERELCFLPLAHAYSCAFNFLVPMAFGAHVFLLGKLPSPKILLKAFEEVKPNLILTVPLILEKIYKKMIAPQLNKRTMKLVMSVPLLNDRIYAQINKKLTNALGGRFREVIVGGAAMNQEVADFLYKIKFPYTIGYGMTECGPLISYDNHKEYVPTSCGQILKGIMEVRIDSEDPYNKVGEIQVRGEKVMKGYYKNEEATRNVFTDDGWLKTGDLGTIDVNKRIYIRGRSKTMVLSSNGQNIYPEEIEAKLNNLPFVLESLVVEREGKLVGLVYPDYDTVDSTGIRHEDLPAIMEQNRKDLNKLLAPYEAVTSIILYPTEFEKTPKRSIKRYLYENY